MSLARKRLYARVFSRSRLLFTLRVFSRSDRNPDLHATRVADGLEILAIALDQVRLASRGALKLRQPLCEDRVDCVDDALDPSAMLKYGIALRRERDRCEVWRGRRIGRYLQPTEVVEFCFGGIHA